MISLILTAFHWVPSLGLQGPERSDVCAFMSLILIPQSLQDWKVCIYTVASNYATTTLKKIAEAKVNRIWPRINLYTQNAFQP